MIEPTLKYISEPSLTFGSGQTAIDPPGWFNAFWSL